MRFCVNTGAPLAARLDNLAKRCIYAAPREAVLLPLFEQLRLAASSAQAALDSMIAGPAPRVEMQQAEITGSIA